MTSKREIFMDLYLNIVVHGAIYGLFVLPAILFFEVRVDVLLLVMVAGMTYFFVVRRLIEIVALMFLAHIIVFLAVWFLTPGLFYVVFYICVAIALVGYSLFQRYRRSMTFSREFILFVPAMLVIVALLLGLQGHGYMHVPYVLLIILTSVGSRLHVRMTTVNDSLTVISQSSSQPVQKILNYDLKAMVVLGVVLIGMALLFHVLLIRPALEVVSGINIERDLEPAPEDLFIPVHDDIQGHGGLPEELLMFDDRGPALIWQVLEQLLIFILLPSLVLALLVFIFIIIRNIIRGWRLRGRHSIKPPDGYEDIKEFIRGPRGWAPWRRGPRNDNKLRRLFRETIIRHMKKGVPIQKTDTPLQMAEKIQTEDINALVEDYGAVRYK